MDGPRDMISVTVLETQALFKLQRLNCRDFSSKKKIRMPDCFLIFRGKLDVSFHDCQGSLN